MGITNSNKELNAARIDCSGKATAVAKRPRRLAKSRLSNPFLQKKQPTNRWAVSFGGEGGIRILEGP